MAGEFDVPLLIEEVKKHRELWDSTYEHYLNRGAKKKAWLDVCHDMEPDFDQLSTVEQDRISYQLIKKWRHIKDSYIRSERKNARTRKFGITGRPYIYSNLMDFIQFNVDLDGGNDANESTEYNNDDDHEEAQSEPEEMDEIKFIKPNLEDEFIKPNIEEVFVDIKRISSENSYEPPQKRATLANFMASLPTSAISLNSTSATQHAPATTTSASSDFDADRSFFESILPSIRDFDEDKKIEFRCEILNVIKRMRSN